MNPIITISNSELKKRSLSEKEMAEFAQKVSEINDRSVYVSPTSMQLIEFVCFLKDSAIPFDFFTTEEEMKSILKPTS